MAVGYIIKRLGVTDDTTNRGLNKVVFNVGLPVLLFRNVSQSNIFEHFSNMGFVAFCVGVTTFMFAVTQVAGQLYFKNKKVAGTFSQVCFRSNFAILGLPLIGHLVGYDDTGLVLVSVAIVIPLYNVLTAIGLAGKEGEELKGLRGLGIIVKNIANPLMVGIALGLIVSLFDWQLPHIVAAPVENLAIMTTPIALLGLGGSLDLSRVRARLKPALVVAFIKLVVGPVVFIPLAVWLGFGREAMIVAFVLLATPTAVSSYAITMSMGGDEDMALNSIVLTMMLSVFTLTFGLFLMMSLGLI